MCTMCGESPAEAVMPPASQPATKRAPKRPACCRARWCEAHARDAPREAEVVADHRAHPGLAADHLGLEHDRAQPLRRAVHRRGEPRRPGADDAEVEHRVLVDLVGASVERRGQLLGRPHGDHALGQHVDERQRGLALVRSDDLATDLRVGFVHAVRHAEPDQQIAERQRQGVMRDTDDPHRFDLGVEHGRAPVREQLGHRVVELLVAGAPGHEQQCVDLSVRLADAQLLAVGQEALEGRHDERT